eukprot:scaffold2724_cov260-Pinguiococcus_pyrenoidosus.AAC.22
MHHVLAYRGRKLLRELLHGPGLHVWEPAQIARCHVHHANSAHGGWRRHGEVHHLEEHLHLHLELDALSVRKAQRHVIVKNRIHVLDPQRVDGPVEHRPLPVLRGVRDVHAHQRRGETVVPLLRELVELAIQLPHRDALRIEHAHADALEHRVRTALLSQVRHDALQNPVACGLARARGAHEGGTEADVEDVEQLDHLVHEAGYLLKPSLVDLFVERHGKLTIVVGGNDGAREEVADDRCEERQVVGEELWNVAVPQRPDQREIFPDVGIGALEGPGHDQDGLDCAETIVIVGLLRQLLGAQDVQLAHLARERLCVSEALGKEHDLRNERVVGDHHCDGPKADLEVVGKFRPTGVSGIHGDDRVMILEDDLHAHEVDVRLLHQTTLPQHGELLRDDGEHLDVDPVELVQARPAAGLRQAPEELPHHFVVDLIAAVEHNAQDSHGLGEVLGTFRLARAGGSSRCRPELEPVRARERQPAAVGERRDH